MDFFTELTIADWIGICVGVAVVMLTIWYYQKSSDKNNR